MKKIEDRTVGEFRTFKPLLTGLIVAAALLLATDFDLAFASDRGPYPRDGNDVMHESKIYGIVEKMPSDRIGAWIIGGREVVVTADTRIKEKHGKAEAGAYVKVEGKVEGKDFTAYEIEVKRSSGR